MPGTGRRDSELSMPDRGPFPLIVLDSPPPSYSSAIAEKRITNHNSSQKPMKEETGRCCFYRSTSKEAMAWSESVDALLASKVGLAAFRAFLKSEFSEENLEFWLACEDYKKTRSSTKIISKAKKIYSEFIQNDAPKEINIDFNTRDAISKNMSHPTLASFDEAQKTILRLMAKDSFPRFLRSDAYKELRDKQQNGNQKKWLF
ncbi:regulator of G-protein signaling 21 [Rhinatrema bivittatum]|uniref:regulator of G-protein signaling 21 n=1 Tax=Rhinatrema bivittatum TaxID=194408 RepID=UPI001127DEF5|nr:regulator of G-protein signaling 21 [Rhinatrema bivittatum]